MPLLDSFKVDHTIMPAPAVRLAKTMQTPKGDVISVFDLRFCVPNEDILSEKGIHTLRAYYSLGLCVMISMAKMPRSVDISPMGCRTGFYISVIGEPCSYDVLEAWEASMRDILHMDTIPEANKYQCGTYAMHSLKEAQEIAIKVLDRGIGVMDTQKLLLKEFA